MHAAPERLTDDFWIGGWEFAGSNAVIDRTAKEIKSLHAWGIRPRILLFINAFGDGHHKRGAIVMGIFQAEFDVRQQATLQVLERVSGLLENPRQMAREPGKGFRANLFKKFGFVPEIEINRCGGIFDLAGDATHGDMLEALFDKQLAGSVENLLAKKLFLAKP